MSVGYKKQNERLKLRAIRMIAQRKPTFRAEHIKLESGPLAHTMELTHNGPTPPKGPTKIKKELVKRDTVLEYE